jgi:hypothetical protein
LKSKAALPILRKPMKRLVAALVVVVASLVFAGGALASPPALSSVTVSADRHPSATFSAPKADDVTIYFASRPDRASDGSFFQENIVAVDFMTSDEIQAGSWTYSDQLDPGTYYVMLNASPNFDLCYIPSTGTYDPSCAYGYSNVVGLTVPIPPIRYRAAVTVLRYARVAYLDLKATPLGVSKPYRVCYRNRAKKKRCVSGRLDGYSWNSSASDELRVSTRKLPTWTTFTWYVGSRAVAKKRVRVRHT